MEMFDPAKHSPEELEGKGLVIAGCSYVLGVLSRESEQGFARHLTNLRSGLSLHIVPLRYSYQLDPADATANSHLKVELTRQMRTGMLRSGGPVPVKPLRTVSIGGVAVELHEFPEGGPELSPDVVEHLNAKRLDHAIEGLNQVLQSQRENTQVLALRARCHQLLGDWTSARSDIDDACEIERNFSAYRLNQIEYALCADDLAEAHVHLQQFKQDFPGEHDGDAFEFHIAIRQGHWEAAERALRDAALPPSEIKRLRAALSDLHGTAAARSMRSWWSRLTGKS